jgi:ABC-type multidrug transport system ATPase subunit
VHRDRNGGDVVSQTTKRLTLHEVTMRRGARRVLSDVSLALGEGEALVITGENGSGKSTLLAIAAGVLSGYAGAVHLDGSCGYAPSTPDVPEHVTANEWLALVASLRGTRAAIDEELARMELGDLEHRKVATLSAGQKQRVSLAAAFLGAPSVLVLDEPEGALDRASVERLAARLRGTTCLLATHDRTLASRIGARTMHLSS